MIRQIKCPHCENDVYIEMGLSAITLVAIEKPDEKGKSAGTIKFSPEERTFLDEAQSLGLLDAFRTACERLEQPTSPKNIESYFLTVLRRSKPKRVPSECLEIVKQSHQGALIEFWGTSGILAITANRRIVQFVPQVLVMGLSVHRDSGNGKSKFRTSVDLERLTEYMRTRWGYVKGKGAFFQNMHRKSLGEFANPSMSATPEADAKRLRE